MRDDPFRATVPPCLTCTRSRHTFCITERYLGTLAAGLQSGIGNVAAGSLFATAQGTAMGAGIPVLGQVIGGAVTGVVGAAAALFL